MDINEYKKLLEVPNDNSSYVDIDWNIRNFRLNIRRLLRRYKRPYNTLLKKYIKKRKS